MVPGGVGSGVCESGDTIVGSARDWKREEEDEAENRAGVSGIRVFESSSSSSPKMKRLTFDAKENERDIFRKDGLSVV